MASKRGETGRFDPDMGAGPMLRRSHIASQRSSQAPAVTRAPRESSRPTVRPTEGRAPGESSRSTARPTEGPSRNEYNFSPAVTRAPGEGLTRAPSHRTGAVGTSILKNGETVKTREVKPSGMFPMDFSRAPGTTSKELMRVPSTSRSRAPSTTSKALMRVPSNSSRMPSSMPSKSSALTSKSTSGGQLRAPGGSYERSIIDASSETVKISSFSRMEMKTSGGTTMSMSHGFSAEYRGHSRD